MVVPGKGKSYNKNREAPTPTVGTTTGAKKTTLAEKNKEEGLADETGQGERADGEMIYREEDDETMDSEMTSRKMGCTHDEMPRSDHLSPRAPLLAQPSQTNGSDTCLDHPEGETQKTYGINGKIGANDEWEFQRVWSEDRIIKRTKTTLLPSSARIKEGFKGAPVGTGPITTNPNPPPNT